MRRAAPKFEAGQFNDSSWRRRNTKWVLLWLAMNTTLVTYGQAAGLPPPHPTIRSRDPLDNTFLISPVLPDDLRRVAVLPLAWEGTSNDLSHGSEVLGPVLLAELTKTKKFEVVAVGHEDLGHQTGRQKWTGVEILPADLLGFLQRVYGCDAVLFCQLTTFRPYAPLAVGWRMKLVEARSGHILWAVDREFDAQSARTPVCARVCSVVSEWFSPESSSNKNWRVENSPSQFGRVTLAQVLSTLPNRKETIKVSFMAADIPSKR
jgi:hypothetical protein